MPIRVQSLRSSTKNTRPAAGSREPGEIFSNFPDKQLGVIDAAKAPLDLIAVRFFSATTNYVAGDFVQNAGHIYRAKTSIVAGAFNPTDWDGAPTTGEFEPPIAAGTTADYWRGDKSWQPLNKSAVGLGAVDNTSDANKPVSGPQQTALDLKANLASPTLTGDPKAPTPAPGDNDTSIATTAYTTAAIAVSDAAQLTALNLKANIASPTFTGDPRAPTPTAGDNDTSVATTAFVTTAVATAVAPMLPDAPADGFVYGRKNNLWATVIGGAHTDDNPPAGPLQDGQLWYRSSDGALFIWYVDVDSGAWIQVNATITSTATAEARNRIVNPAMQISQENAGAGTTSGWYGADQWQGLFSGTGFAVAFGRGQEDSTPTSNHRRMTAAVTTPKASLATGDYIAITQKIEGTRIADFDWGKATAKQVVLRFMAKADVGGTYSISLRGGTGRVFLAAFTLPTNVWTAITQVIPGDTAGTWVTDSNLGLELGIAHAVGSSLLGAAGWQSGNLLGVTGMTNNAAAVNGLSFGDVGLYLDPNATGTPPPWQMPDEAQELRACQRYFQRGNIIVFTGAASVTTTLAVEMRVIPAITGGGAGFAATVSGLQFYAFGQTTRAGALLSFSARM